MHRLLRYSLKATPFLTLFLVGIAGTSISLMGFAYFLLTTPHTQNTQSIAPAVYDVYAATPPTITPEVHAAPVTGDARATKIRQYLESINRPLLVPYAELMVQVADTYQLPWALLPAIAGQESSFCRTIPHESNNCWGWAITATQSHSFDTMDGAINRVGRSLRQDFMDKYGFQTPCEIMRKYTPGSLAKGGSWCKGVQFFMDEMEDFQTQR